MNSQSMRWCATCRQPLPPDAPLGTCPRCAFAAALLSTPPRSAQLPGYELLAEIGRGGMGVIYKARHLALNRNVAVKMILSGRLAGKAEVRRFKTEAEAAAALHHPNIVAIHEIGEHEGLLYFTMSYVEGGDLAQAMAKGSFTTRKAVELVLVVARAIQYAHQCGVIHRDLKPANILLNAVGVPHITDFGLAKLLEGDSQQTMTSMFLGTPAYTAPEQAGGCHQATPTIDVYSLGAILYHLLTHRPPFMAGSAGELLEKVKTQEPPPMRPLNAQVDRDLETICRKCMEKDPSRRYQSANEVADDLGRWLAAEPIHAHPASRFYHFQKLVRRHKWLFATTAAMALFLVGGLVVSTAEAVRATRAEQEQRRLLAKAQAAESIARTEAGKSRQVAQLLQEMLQQVGPSVALGQDTKMLKGILDHTAERLDKDLRGQPEVSSELEAIIASVYRELGQYDRAEAIARKSLNERQALFGNQHPNVASAQAGLASVLARKGRLTEAESLYRTALGIAKNTGNETPELAGALINLGMVLFLEGELKEAEKVDREALGMREKLFPSDDPLIADGLNNLGQVVQSEASLPEAEALYRRALSLRLKSLGADHPAVALSLNNVGQLIQLQGQFREAENLHREALGIQQRLFPDGHPDMATSLNNLAGALQGQGKFVEAERVSREALNMFRNWLDGGHANVAAALNNLAMALQGQGKFYEAETNYRAALALRKSAAGAERQLVVPLLNNLSFLLVSQGKLDEAEASYREVVSLERDYFRRPHVYLAVSLRELGRLLERRGQFEEAEVCYRESLEIRKKLARESLPPIGPLTQQLAHLLAERGKVSEARAFYQEAIDIYAPAAERGENSAMNALALLLATCRDDTIRDGPRAVALAEKAVAATHRTDANILDTLACAYGELGEFAQAVTVQKEAIALVKHPVLIQDFQSRLTLYEAQSPAREP